MKKRGRGVRTGNPGKKWPRGPSPVDRPGRWWRWLRREHNAFWGLPHLSRELVVLIVLIVAGLIMWAWRSLTAA